MRKAVAVTRRGHRRNKSSEEPSGTATNSNGASNSSSHGSSHASNSSSASSSTAIAAVTATAPVTAPATTTTPAHPVSSKNGHPHLPAAERRRDQPPNNSTGKPMSPDEIALTAKNYRLAKELSELRVRHREECKHSTKLAMDNMNLASRCREANERCRDVMEQNTKIRKEAAFHHKKAADALNALHRLQAEIKIATVTSPSTHTITSPPLRNGKTKTPLLVNTMAVTNTSSHSASGPENNSITNGTSFPTVESSPGGRSLQERTAIDSPRFKNGTLHISTPNDSPKSLRDAEARSAALSAEMDRMDRILAAHADSQSPQPLPPTQRPPQLPKLPSTTINSPTPDLLEKAKKNKPSVPPESALSKPSVPTPTPPSATRFQTPSPQPPQGGVSPQLVSSDDYEDESVSYSREELVTLSPTSAASSNSTAGSPVALPTTAANSDSCSSSNGTSSPTKLLSAETVLRLSAPENLLLSTKETKESDPEDDDGKMDAERDQVSQVIVSNNSNKDHDDDDWMDQEIHEFLVDQESKQQQPSPRVRDTASKSFFPHSASPKIGRGSVGSHGSGGGSGSYNEEYPADITTAAVRKSHMKRKQQQHQKHGLGDFSEAAEDEHSAQALHSASLLLVQHHSSVTPPLPPGSHSAHVMSSNKNSTSSNNSPLTMPPFEKMASRDNSKSSLDAFEASFHTSFADVFSSPKPDALIAGNSALSASSSTAAGVGGGEEKKSSPGFMDDLYDPFSTSSPMASQPPPLPFDSAKIGHVGFPPPPIATAASASAATTTTTADALNDSPTGSSLRERAAAAAFSRTSNHRRMGNNNNSSNNAASNKQSTDPPGTDKTSSRLSNKSSHSKPASSKSSTSRSPNAPSLASNNIQDPSSSSRSKHSFGSDSSSPAVFNGDHPPLEINSNAAGKNGTKRHKTSIQEQMDGFPDLSHNSPSSPSHATEQLSLGAQVTRTRSGWPPHRHSPATPQGSTGDGSTHPLNGFQTPPPLTKLGSWSSMTTVTVEPPRPEKTGYEAARARYEKVVPRPSNVSNSSSSNGTNSEPSDERSQPLSQHSSSSTDAPLAPSTPPGSRTTTGGSIKDRVAAYVEQASPGSRGDTLKASSATASNGSNGSNGIGTNHATNGRSSRPLRDRSKDIGGAFVSSAYPLSDEDDGDIPMLRTKRTAELGHVTNHVDGRKSTASSSFRMLPSAPTKDTSAPTSDRMRIRPWESDSSNNNNYYNNNIISTVGSAGSGSTALFGSSSGSINPRNEVDDGDNAASNSRGYASHAAMTKPRRAVVGQLSFSSNDIIGVPSLSSTSAQAPSFGPSNSLHRRSQFRSEAATTASHMARDI